MCQDFWVSAICQMPRKEQYFASVRLLPKFQGLIIWYGNDVKIIRVSYFRNVLRNVCDISRLFCRHIAENKRARVLQKLPMAILSRFRYPRGWECWWSLHSRRPAASLDPSKPCRTSIFRTSPEGAGYLSVSNPDVSFLFQGSFVQCEKKGKASVIS